MYASPCCRDWLERRMEINTLYSREYINEFSWSDDIPGPAMPRGCEPRVRNVWAELRKVWALYLCFARGLGGAASQTPGISCPRPCIMATNRAFECDALVYSSSNRVESILREKLGLEKVPRRLTVHFPVVKTNLKQTKTYFQTHFWCDFQTSISRPTLVFRE